MSIHYLISFDLTHGKFHVDTEDPSETSTMHPKTAAKITGQSHLVAGWPVEDGPTQYTQISDGEPEYPSDFKETVQAILDGLGRHFKTTDTQIVRLP